MVVWLSKHWVEIFGTVTGFLYIYLSIKEKAALWIVGFLTSLAYVYVFFKSKFYADMSLQVYYLLVSVYGFVYWIRGNRQALENKNDKLPIQTTGLKLKLTLFIVFLILFVIMGFILDKYTDSPVPWWDSFTTSASIVATWMLARKYLEQWLIWVVVDFVSMVLYIVKGLYPTSVLFLFYTILAVVGYFQWLRSYRNQNLVLVNA